jgi:hypothetical protein
MAPRPPNYSHERSQRERAQAAKADAKAERRAEKSARKKAARGEGPADGGTPPAKSES